MSHLFNMRKHLARIVPLVVLVAVASLSGCGSKTGKISGKVTLDGTPVKGAAVSITVTGSKKAVPVAQTNSKGEFTLTNVPVGAGTFTVDMSALKNMQQQLEKAKTVPGAGADAQNMPEEQRKQFEKMQAGQGGMNQRLEEQLKGAVWPSEKYASPETSGLKYTVTPGSQTHNIELKNEG